jgi:copper resistance protein B
MWAGEWQESEMKGEQTMSVVETLVPGSNGLPLTAEFSQREPFPTEMNGEFFQVSTEFVLEEAIDSQLPTFSRMREQKFSKDNHHDLNMTDENEAEDWPEPVHDSETYWFILVDQLEYRGNDGENSFYWDIVSWVGGDYERLWLKSEGDVGFGDGNGEGELQLLYGKLIAPFWDLQVGLRYDQLYGDSGRSRGFAVIAVEGLAPYLFEVEASLFISHQGDVSARFKSEYELLLSQKLVLQPKLEINLAAQQVEEFGVGSGINDLELGLRMRYEFNRQFAPYIGINWTRKFGDTAKFAREEGESDDQVSVVGGIRLLF